MKLRNLFLAAIVALGMMACNNEEVPQVIDGAQSTISIKVLPTSNGSGTKVVGDISGGLTSAGLAAESAIKQLQVYLFFGDVLQVYKDTTNANGVTEVTGIETSTGPKSIFIVANAGLGSVTSKTDLLAKTKDLPTNINNGLVMTGQTTTDIIVAPGQNYYGYSDAQLDGKDPGAKHSVGAPLKITRVNARVAIVAADLADNLTEGQEAIFNGLTNIDVAIFNVPKTTNLFGASLATNADYIYGGEAWPSSLGSYVVGTVETTFKDSPVTLPIANTAAPYYYVNENTAANKKEQMLIVLRGKPTLDGAEVKAEGLYTDKDGYTYYPVWVNAADYDYAEGYVADSKVLRNTQYNISLLIKGIGNPTIDPVQDAFLDVIVEVEPWKVVNQGVIWN